MREVVSPHTGLLRLGLAVPQSIAFWQNATQDLTLKELRTTATEENWFGDVSAARSDYLVGQFQKRFPFEVRTLLSQESRPLSQSRVICHWHLQLTDPIYRCFTSDYLLSCWTSPKGSATIDSALAWVSGQELTRDWKAPTLRRMTSGLLAAAAEAGLCSSSGKERQLKVPPTTDRDLKYLARLLKLAEPTSSPSAYLVSIGRSEEDL